MEIHQELIKKEWLEVGPFWQSAAASFIWFAPKSHNRKEGSGLIFLC